MARGIKGWAGLRVVPVVLLGGGAPSVHELRHHLRPRRRLVHGVRPADGALDRLKHLGEATAEGGGRQDTRARCRETPGQGICQGISGRGGCGSTCRGRAGPGWR